MAQYRFQWPPITKTVIGVAIVAFLGWFIPTIVEPVQRFASEHLWLTTDNVVADFEVWTIASYAVFHLDFVSAFFTVFAFWLFGTELQRVWSPTKFWTVQAIASVFGGLLAFGTVWALGMETPVVGYHAATMALLTGFCRLHWDRELSIFIAKLTGKTMLLLFFGLNALFAVLGGAWYALALSVAGVIVGFFASNGPRLSFRDLRTRFNRWRSRRHLKVMRKTPDGEWVN